jgi:hypothetical protein
MPATCPSHLTLFAVIMKLLIRQSSLLISYFLRLRPKYTLLHPNFEHPQPMLVLKYMSRIFNQCKTTGKFWFSVFQSSDFWRENEKRKNVDRMVTSTESNLLLIDL